MATIVGSVPEPEAPAEVAGKSSRRSAGQVAEMFVGCRKPLAKSGILHRAALSQTHLEVALVIPFPRCRHGRAGIAAARPDRALCRHFVRRYFSTALAVKPWDGA
jgi:hypothetical protein